MTNKRLYVAMDVDRFFLKEDGTFEMPSDCGATVKETPAELAAVLTDVPEHPYEVLVYELVPRYKVRSAKVELVPVTSKKKKK